MACFNRASPAVAAILHKLHNAEKPMDVDHNLYEFGSVKYHIQTSATDPQNVYLSISMPPLSAEATVSNALPSCTLRDMERVYKNIAETVEYPKEGFVLTLRVDFAKLPQKKEDCAKAINEISSLQAIILSSQLKDMLWNLGCKEMTNGLYRPIKLVYHPKEPFFIIRMPEKVTAIFPMRFKDDSDVVLATSFFQELMDVGYSEVCAKAPLCTWSPIPPPELRGESFQHLTTNGGFVSFDILSRHVKGTKADKVVWALINFHAFVKYHVKCTRGFIQRKMRQQLGSLVEVMQNARIGQVEKDDNLQSHKCVARLVSFSKGMILKRKCVAFSDHINMMRSRIRIKGLDQIRRRWFRVPKFASFRKHYAKID